MKLLPEKFTRKGFKHKQIIREEEVALFKRQSVEFPKVVHFEVVIISSHNGTTIEGNYIEAGELYPSTSQWGEKGWTCNSQERGEELFREIVKKNSKSKKLREAAAKKKGK